MAPGTALGDARVIETLRREQCRAGMAILTNVGGRDMVARLGCCAGSTDIHEAAIVATLTSRDDPGMGKYRRGKTSIGRVVANAAILGGRYMVDGLADHVETAVMTIGAAARTDIRMVEARRRKCRGAVTIRALPGQQGHAAAGWEMVWQRTDRHIVVVTGFAGGRADQRMIQGAGGEGTAGLVTGTTIAVGGIGHQQQVQMGVRSIYRTGGIGTVMACITLLDEDIRVVMVDRKRRNKFLRRRKVTGAAIRRGGDMVGILADRTDRIVGDIVTTRTAQYCRINQRMVE